MRLSEAIRLGSAMKPQARHRFLFDGRTCAQGAALDAMGELSSDANECHEHVAALWPWACARITITCPCEDGEACIYSSGQRATKSEMRWIIAHLNNDIGWTRERIADFVELYEPQAILPEVHEDGHELWLSHSSEGFYVQG